MEFLRRTNFFGPSSPLTHNFFTSEKAPVAKNQFVDKSNLSDEDHAVVAFVRDNWKNIVTAFLLYMFAAATFTKLKGRELVAFSSVAAVWTVFQGFSAWSLAAAAPIIYGIAKVVFNWATSGNSTPAQREYRPPVFPAQQTERRDTAASQQRRGQTSPDRREGASSRLEEQDLRSFEEAWNGAQRTPSQPGAIKSPADGVSVVVDQSGIKEAHTPPSTSPRSTDRQPTVVASPIGVATVISVPTSANLQEEMEETWSQVSEEERSGRQTPALHDPIDLETGLVDSQLELTSPLPTTTVAEEEEVVDTATQQVKKKEEVSDRAITEQKLREARRIVWQFAQIANPAQAGKISRLEPKIMVAAFMFSRDAFFTRMEVTPEQRIALLLPSVLTEAQEQKIADLDLNGRYQSATYFQEKFFDFLEVTAIQKKELIGPPVQQLAKL